MKTMKNGFLLSAFLLALLCLFSSFALAAEAEDGDLEASEEAEDESQANNDDAEADCTECETTCTTDDDCTDFDFCLDDTNKDGVQENNCLCKDDGKCMKDYCEEDVDCLPMLCRVAGEETPDCACCDVYCREDNRCAPVNCFFDADCLPHEICISDNETRQRTCQSAAFVEGGVNNCSQTGKTATSAFFLALALVALFAITRKRLWMK